MARRISDSVVVITGASSGIGRATAHQFARRGATLVLAARREDALHDAARECQELGGRALVVPTDVTREGEVQNLARQAVENFGRIDVWVNNAAVTLFGRLEETPWESYRRVLETNLFGYIHGARAALPYFREQGSGVLINIASVVAECPQPYTSAYVATKFAIRGLADCLRMELSLDPSHDIHVCTVMPPSVDTPLFQQAANYTGRAVQPLKPVYPPERIARMVVSVARNPRREVIVGMAGKMLATQHQWAPGLYERAAARMVDRGHFQDKPAAATQGNLFDPMPEYASVHGGWLKPKRSKMAWLALAGAAVGLPVLAWWASRRDLGRRLQEAACEGNGWLPRRAKELVG